MGFHVSLGECKPKRTPTSCHRLRLGNGPAESEEAVPRCSHWTGKQRGLGFRVKGLGFRVQDVDD